MFSPLSNLFSPSNANQFGPLKNAFQNHGLRPTRPFESDNANRPNIQQSDRFELFNSVLQKAYQRLSENLQTNQTPAPAQEYNFQTVEKISADEAAGNILAFIKQRLSADKANGATTEELNQRLDQALTGFEQGFNEAKDILQGLGVLDDKLSSEINETYQRVNQGIDELRERINRPVDETNNVSQLSFEGQVSQSRSFTLELTTQDGDTISIDIARERQVSRSFSFNQSEDGTSIQASRAFSSSSNFSLNVQGELDEDELTAINELLADIDGIAQDFYSGNLDEAFSAALDLNFDSEELSSLDLNLQQSTSVSAIAAYQSNADAPAANPFKGVGAIFQQVNNILENAQKFADPLQLIDDISAGLNQIDKPVEDTAELIDQPRDVIREDQFRDNFLTLIDQFLS